MDTDAQLLQAISLFENTISERLIELNTTLGRVADALEEHVDRQSGRLRQVD